MELPKTARRIKDSKDYVDVDGSIYTYRSNYKGNKTDTVIKKSQRVLQGYKYCGVYDCETGKCKNRRVNRVVAETFIENENNLSVVGHRNNIKTDNRVENLYWCTYKDNTKKAVKDGLMRNDKGYEDSQSKPVVIFNTYTNEEIGRYGSLREASKMTGLSLTTLNRQAKYKRPVRKPFYCRFQDEESVKPSTINKCEQTIESSKDE